MLSFLSYVLLRCHGATVQNVLCILKIDVAISIWHFFPLFLFPLRFVFLCVRLLFGAFLCRAAEKVLPLEAGCLEMMMLPLLLLASATSATSHFEITFSLPASALNKIHRTTQEIISFSTHNGDGADLNTALEQTPVPPAVEEDFVEQMSEMLTMVSMMESEQMPGLQMPPMEQPGSAIEELAPPSPSPPPLLMGRPDFVGGARLEGFGMSKLSTKQSELTEPTEPTEPTCYEALKSAYDSCGADRCAAPLSPGPEEMEAFEEEYSLDGNILTSDACTDAFEHAMARMDECKDQMICPKMLAAMDKMPMMGPHGKAHLRGGDGSHGPPHHPHTFSDALQHLEDENLCACGGRIGPGRFARLMVSGCGGLPGVPPAFIVAAVVLGFFFWLLIYVRVVACLRARFARRNDGALPSVGRRICHRLVAVPLTWLLINVAGMAVLCLGPFGILVCCTILLMIRRRKLAALDAAARRQRILGTQVAQAPAKSHADDFTVEREMVVCPTAFPPAKGDVVVGTSVVAA